MPSRIDSEDLTDLPSTDINPYEVLGVPKDATAKQITTAYRKQALRWHPDKVTDSALQEEAKAKFQELALAYAVLSDERRRKRYDVTGRTEESLEDDENPFSWAEFYRSQFEAVVSADAIEEVKQEYQGSDKEREDVLAAYVDYKGNMDAIFENIMLSDIEADEDRFRAMIQTAIDNGDVQPFKKFTNESAKRKSDRQKKARAEAKEAEELAEELGVKDKLFGKKGKKKDSGEDALKALIMGRQKDREANFFDNLEAKYAPKPKGKAGKRAPDDEPSEEMFERNRKKGKKDNAAAKPAPKKSRKAKA